MENMLQTLDKKILASSYPSIWRKWNVGKYMARMYDKNMIIKNGLIKGFAPLFSAIISIGSFFRVLRTISQGLTKLKNS